MKNKLPVFALALITAFVNLSVIVAAAPSPQTEFGWQYELPEELTPGMDITVLADGLQNPSILALALYDNHTLSGVSLGRGSTATLTLPNTFSTETNWTLKAFAWESLPSMISLENHLEIQLGTDMDITGTFTDIRFLNAVRDIVGKGETEPIYRSDIRHIQTLDVSKKELQSLDGIANFQSLETLYCWDNSLTALDVSGNPHLKTLLCYFNEFQELDVTNNPELEVFDCSYNMDLTTLHMPNHSALRELECNYTGLTDLHISSNGALTRLICYGCELKELTVSNAVNLLELLCWGNDLTALDISGNPNLNRLDCSYNQLKSIDVSNNKALAKLDCKKNLMQSADDVIGWEQTGLVLGETFLYEPQKDS